MFFILRLIRSGISLVVLAVAYFSGYLIHVLLVWLVARFLIKTAMSGLAAGLQEVALKVIGMGLVWVGMYSDRVHGNASIILIGVGLLSMMVSLPKFKTNNRPVKRDVASPVAPAGDATALHVTFGNGISDAAPAERERRTTEEGQSFLGSVLTFGLKKK